jgi:Fe2+ transport system protein FeoA
MTAASAQSDTTYIVSHIEAHETGMKDFLLTLGCYPGEAITVISRLAGNVVINIKNARYSIDEELACAIKLASAGAPMAGDLKVG